MSNNVICVDFCVMYNVLYVVLVFSFHCVLLCGVLRDIAVSLFCKYEMLTAMYCRSHVLDIVR